MKITDDIERSNFNPQMLKSCTDTSYQCGYEQGRKDAIDEFAENNNTECKCEEATDYDCISKSRLVRQILKIEDIQISPKTLNRILELIQNQVPYNEVDYNEQ